jgi:lipopolysaccharide export system permease protein
MAKHTSISGYLSKNFQSSFFTIFLPLFFIGSLVFIIKISALTASIQISFVEMMYLFGYHLPAILFYTLPISFLIAVVVTLVRLSNDNELMALFALGASSKVVLSRLFFIATLFSLILLILSLGLMPKTKQQFKAFKIKKTAEAQININPSKLGQKFGNLFVYVKAKEGKSLKNIVIYNKDVNHSDQLFIAKEATFENNNSLVTLTLKEGSGYTYSEDSLKKITYKTMQLFKSLDTEGFSYKNIIQYWTNLANNPKRKSKIFFFIFSSLIPILALMIIASFAIINPRYQKNHAYSVLALTVITLYSIATLLERNGTVLTTTLASIVFLILGAYLYKRLVLRFF